MCNGAKWDDGFEGEGAHTRDGGCLESGKMSVPVRIRGILSAILHCVEPPLAIDNRQ